jgi:hypothetical protein
MRLLLPLFMLACSSTPVPLEKGPDTGSGEHTGTTDSASGDDTAPSTEEICDGQDNDGDGLVDEGFDEDGDGWTTCWGDCDDDDPFIHPDAPDVCDGIDNDCSGATDEQFDDDGDGDSECGSDCDDNDPATSGHLPEICDGVDNNCDDVVDEGFDEDGDGWLTCRGDCDDTNAAVYPGAEEVCDGATNNCDGEPVDETGDLDGDGVSICDGDCDDASAAAFPGATETCDGIDNDCNGAVDELASCFGCTTSGPYLVCTTAVPWTTASATCATFGTQLAKADDVTENTHIGTLLGGVTGWIGLNDRATEGTWLWEDGTGPSFTSWNTGEPNDSGGEDCVHINHARAGGWNDYPCANAQPFVCES